MPRPRVEEGGGGVPATRGIVGPAGRAEAVTENSEEGKEHVTSDRLEFLSILEVNSAGEKSQPHMRSKQRKMTLRTCHSRARGGRRDGRRSRSPPGSLSRAAGAPTQR
ncbi:hypothetical protein NDU88_004114 [Pleurodeles waltl]|uniref:Uncharacterized protein n=1 Tax=Pleurodeles waltl TaxID=8319 RepID=A0AAV7QBB3_PLEWA|nr:hypothetical protein NDU88_004114 [Pleurodeles waltl]